MCLFVTFVCTLHVVSLLCISIMNELMHSMNTIPFNGCGFCGQKSTQVLVQTRIGTTREESETDNELTLLFHSLGEKPVVSLSHHAEGNISFLGYNSSCNCWESEIETTQKIIVVITGGNIVVMDCGVRSTKHFFYTNRLTNLALSTNHISQSFTVASPQEPPSVFRDQHSLGTQVILYGGTNFMTTDNFATVKTFQIDVVSSVIQEVAFTLSTMCVVANGEFFTLAVGGTTAIQQTGLPSQVIQHVSGRGYSELEGYDSTEDLVVVWTHEENESMFVSSDGGFQFEELTLPFVGSIHSVLLHPMKKEVIVLVVSEESMQAKFLSYNMDEQDWNSDGLNFNISGGNLTATFFPDVFGDLLTWEHRSLYYSPNKGLTVRSLTVYTTDGNSLAPHDFQTEGYIKHVSVGPNGQFTVLTYDNRLFYGTTGVGYAVEIQSGLQPISDVVLSFDAIGELKLVLFQNTSVGIRKVPTYSLLLSSLYPPPACPYLQWNHNIVRSLYYLDSRETLILWASVVPRQWQPNDLSFVVSDLSVISYHTENQLLQTAIAGSVERNMSVYIQPSQVTMANRSSALTAVKLLITNNNLACQDTNQVITQLSIKCPPSRHIRIRRPSGFSNRCPTFEDLMYKISKNDYDPELRGQRSVRGTVDKEVHYNYSQYGCPIRVPYTQRFRPVLELYDDSSFVEEVNADFVIWELHGRSDFKYTSNAENAGCISTPQTWTEMTQDGLYPSVAWTPQTYRHCFQRSGNGLNGRVPYQILNSSGVSSLSWYGHNGIYVFAVTVVATDYSFCNLTATFSVEVYGAIKNSYVGYIFLVLTCLSGVVVLVISYFCYRYKTGRHEKKE